MAEPRRIEQDDLERRFAFHPATSETGPMHDEVRASCQALAEQLVSLLPPGREASLAITNLETTMMWANAAIARHGGGE